MGVGPAAAAPLVPFMARRSGLFGEEVTSSFGPTVWTFVRWLSMREFPWFSATK